MCSCAQSRSWSRWSRTVRCVSSSSSSSSSEAPTLVLPPLLASKEGPAPKVASSTPTRPLETPPYTLVPLLHPVFASSRPTSPPPPPPALTAAPPSSPPPVSRITQLVSSVAAAAAASSSTPTPPAPQPSLRTVEAAAHHVWLGTSHGTVRLYSVAQQHADHAPSIEGLLSPGPASPPSTPRRSSRQHQVRPSLPRAPASP